MPLMPKEVRDNVAALKKIAATLGDDDPVKLMHKALDALRPSNNPISFEKEKWEQINLLISTVLKAKDTNPVLSGQAKNDINTLMQMISVKGNAVTATIIPPVISPSPVSLEKEKPIKVASAIPITPPVIQQKAHSVTTLNATPVEKVAPAARVVEAKRPIESTSLPTKVENEFENAKRKLQGHVDNVLMLLNKIPLNELDEKTVKIVNTVKQNTVNLLESNSVEEFESKLTELWSNKKALSSAFQSSDNTVSESCKKIIGGVGVALGACITAGLGVAAVGAYIACLPFSAAIDLAFITASAASSSRSAIAPVAMVFLAPACFAGAATFELNDSISLTTTPPEHIQHQQNLKGAFNQLRDTFKNKVEHTENVHSEPTAELK